jgi:hypothetical protein
VLENSVNSCDTKVFLAGETCKWPLKKKKSWKEGNRKQFYGSVSVLGKCNRGSFVCA